MSEKQERTEAELRLADLILVDAVRRKATEIAIGPLSGAPMVTYVIDGVRYQMIRPPVEIGRTVADIWTDMAEKGGRFDCQLGRRKLVTVRVISANDTITLGIIEGGTDET